MAQSEHPYAFLKKLQYSLIHFYSVSVVGCAQHSVWHWKMAFLLQKLFKFPKKTQCSERQLHCMETQFFDPFEIKKIRIAQQC